MGNLCHMGISLLFTVGKYPKVCQMAKVTILNSKINFIGTMKYKNGAVYKGSFVNGEKDGEGTLTKLSREYKYEGDWYKDKPSGVGVLKEGSITYKGEFEEGKKV